MMPSGSGGLGPLHHIGIVVPTLNPAAEKIRAVVNGTTADGGEDTDMGVAWTWIESPGNPIIELLAPTGDEGPIARWLTHREPGLHHLSFMPANLDQVFEHVHECCVPVLEQARFQGDYEQLYVDPEHTGGVLFHVFRHLAAGAG